jgi:hypothetical protein
MKSFIFATSYIDNDEAYEKRYLKWIRYYQDLSFTDDKSIFLIDDGSPDEFISKFKKTKHMKVIDERDDIFNDEKLEGASWLDKSNIFHFNKRLGINPADNTPGIYGSTVGWYRSFFHSVEIANKFQFDKIIHIESDAYLITEKVCTFIDALETGWTSLWCPRYSFPETSIQIICRDQFDNLEKLRQTDLSEFSTVIAEDVLPITQVTQSFIGDRYGECTDKQVPGVDYYCQCNINTNLKYKN